MADGGGSPAAGGAVCGVAWSAELGAEVCARIAAGESIMAVCRGPGMPHRTSVRNWANSRPEFAEALAAAQAARRLRWRARDAGRLAERLARPRSPKATKASTYTPEMGALICDRLMNGESVVAIARDPDMPCAGTIYGWANRHPEFAEIYGSARVLQADYLADEAREVALGATPKSVWADRLRFDTIRWLTARLAPKKYVERLVVAGVLAAEKAESQAEAPRQVHMLVTRFVRSPKDPKKVLAIPPRNSEEAAAYAEAYGEPYSGPHAATPQELAAADAARAQDARRSGGGRGEAW